MNRIFQHYKTINELCTKVNIVNKLNITDMQNNNIYLYEIIFS